MYTRFKIYYAVLVWTRMLTTLISLFMAHCKNGMTIDVWFARERYVHGNDKKNNVASIWMWSCPPKRLMTNGIQYCWGRSCKFCIPCEKDTLPLLRWSDQPRHMRLKISYKDYVALMKGEISHITKNYKFVHYKFK